MGHNVANWDIWKPEIDAFIKDESGKQPKGAYTELFKVKSTNRLTKTENTYAGLNPMVDVGEGGDAEEDESKEGYSTDYTRAVFRKKQVFTKVLMDTDQSGTAEELARDLPRTQAYSRGLNIWSMIRRGWDSTLTYGDGKPLVSTAHPRKDAGTAQYNTFSDGVQKGIEYDNVLELQDVLISTVSNQGNLMNVGAIGNNKCIVVGPYLREQAFQIAGVEASDMEPDTAENNANYFRKGDKFDVLVVNFLCYEAALQAGETAVAKTAAGNYWDTLWGVVDRESCKKYFKVFTGVGYPYYDDEINKNNEALNKFAYDHYAFGNTAWYPGAWSKGDSTDYTG